MTDPVLTDPSDDPAPPAPDDDVPARPRPARRHPVRAVGRFLLRRRSPIILLVLLVGLGYAALLGGRMLWADIPEPPIVPRTVTCWDGSEATGVECPAPDGAAGLHWVFPSFRPQARSCVAAPTPADGRLTQFDCVERLRGKSVTLSYSRRSTPAQALTFFARRYPGIKPRSEAGGDRLVYSDAAPRSDGTFEVAAGYVDYPYAVTVRAPSRALARVGLDQLVDFRPAANILVRPAR